MRPLIFMLTLLLHSAALMAQDNCNDAALLGQIGRWKKVADVGMRDSKDQALAIRYLDSFSRFFQAMFPIPKGMEPAWYRSMNDPTFPGNPQPYTFNSIYYPWYCNKDMHKMMLSGETGTWAFVYVNFLNPFLTEQYDRIKLNPDETPIYLLPLRKGSWKGYDLYTPSTARQQGSCIVISQGGLPWKPVSQETYLQYVRRFLQSQQKEQDASLAKSKEDARKQIEHIQNSPNLSPESKQTMLNALQKQQEQQQQTAASSRAAYINYFDQQLKTVDDYLAKTSPSVLQQPAFIPKYSKSIFDGNFSSEAAGGRMVVTANPDYTDHQLSSCRPQFMILFWKWEKDAPSQNFKQQFESDFPVEKLQAMLGDVAGKNNHPSKNTK